MSAKSDKANKDEIVQRITKDECCCGRKVSYTDCSTCNIGPCDECGSCEPRADHDGKLLCYDHWHKARERTTPYAVRRTTTPEHDNEYGHLFAGGNPPSVLTKAEAEAMASRFNTEAEESSKYSGRPVWERWDAYQMPQDFWYQGERQAHPGYLNRRRYEILANGKRVDL